MNYTQTQALLGHVDIYLIDQILKNNYGSDETILDAGCGEGRNLKWFYSNNYIISGIDTDIQRIENAQKTYPNSIKNFQVASLANMPYQANEFDHIICCAVLHFAQSEKHFTAMFTEMIRVLKKDGTLFIRMASNIGLDGNTSNIQDGMNRQSGAYYLTRERIALLLKTYRLELIEPIKTTNVQDLRAMTTLVLRKV